MRISVLIAALLAAVLAAPLPAFAWGAVGHRMINNAAIRSLPPIVPAFVRTPEAIDEITMMGPEADRLRDGEKMYTSDFQADHFLNAGDDGMIGGVVPISQLPVNREAYDTALRKGSPVNGVQPDQYAVGTLPYAIADGYAQVEIDFAIWRVDAYGEAHAQSDADRMSFGLDRKLRELLIVRDIGYFGHFVADGSQPLHVTVHYNGWGKYPNPNNYSTSNKIHSKFESAFVTAHETIETIIPLVGPYTNTTTPILARVGTYLAATVSHVTEVYKLEASGGLDNGTPDAVSFTANRLADGARMLRDLIADAYVNSANLKVGYPGVLVKDVENGTVVPVPYASFKG